MTTHTPIPRTSFLHSILASVLVFSVILSLVPQTSRAVTIEELLEKIAMLQAQIKELKEQQDIPEEETFSYTWDTRLRIGMRKNEDVRALQNALLLEGIYRGKVDGNFGPLTKRAVTAFQNKYNLEADGVVGTGTRAKLNQLYGSGASSVVGPLSINIVSGANLDSTQVYTPGQQVVLFIKASEPDGTMASSGEGFNVQGYIYDALRKVTYGGANGSYNANTGLWTVVLKAPTESSIRYDFEVFLYCSDGSLACGTKYTSDSQVKAFFEFTLSSNSISQGQLVYSVTPTSLIQGNTYAFNVSIRNAPANTPIYFYLNRPDGSIKESGFNRGTTDSSGLFSGTTSLTITEGQTGWYSSWVMIDGKKSNVVMFEVKQAGSSPTVFSPNGGDIWTTGSTQIIKWNPVVGHNYVLIDLVRGANNAHVKSISVGNAMSSGQVTWQIPSDIQTGNDYKIYINASNTVGTYGTLSDTSNAPFTIAAAGPDLVWSSGITLGGPDAASNNTATFAASWKNNGNIQVANDYDIKLEIYKNGILQTLATSDGPFTGQQALAVGESRIFFTRTNYSFSPGASYEARLILDSANIISEFSESNNVTSFTFTTPTTAPSIAVTFPNGGELIPTGPYSYVILYSVSDIHKITNPGVRFDIVQNGIVLGYRCVSSSGVCGISRDSSNWNFSWDVGSYTNIDGSSYTKAGAGTGYQIRAILFDGNTEIARDISNTPFSIVAAN